MTDTSHNPYEQQPRSDEYDAVASYSRVILNSGSRVAELDAILDPAPATAAQQPEVGHPVAPDEIVADPTDSDELARARQLRDARNIVLDIHRLQTYRQDNNRHVA